MLISRRQSTRQRSQRVPLPCAHEYGLEEAAVDAANPFEARLLHEHRHSLRPDGEVCRGRSPGNDFLRAVLRHEFKSVVERAVPTPNLGKAASTPGPRCGHRSPWSRPFQATAGLRSPASR
jgi:hypothetical protein